MMSLMVSIVLFLFPRDVLDEMWDLNETVSEGFPTDFFKKNTGVIKCILNVSLANDHLYGKLLFTRLSLMSFLMVSFCAVHVPTKMFWVRCWTVLSQFLRVFLPTFEIR